MACLTCHDAPAHQAAQTFTPPCASCHVEHEGASRLAATPEASCTQCHADLKVKEGQTNFALNIKSFSNGHPEFAAVRAGHAPDPGTIKLNHQIHLKAGLKGPTGPMHLVCADCHQEALPAPRTAKATFLIGAMTLNLTLPAAMDSNLKSLSPEMAPVNFERHCMNCHPLVFDTRFNDPAPHKETQIVQAYVIDQYTNYIAQHPGEVHEPVRLNSDLPSRPIPPAAQQRHRMDCPACRGSRSAPLAEVL